MANEFVMLPYTLTEKFLHYAGKLSINICNLVGLVTCINYIKCKTFKIQMQANLDKQ